jgi:hypothetical protein
MVAEKEKWWVTPWLMNERPPARTTKEDKKYGEGV